MFRIRLAKAILVISAAAVMTTTSGGASVRQKSALNANSGLVVTYTISGQVETVITVEGSALTRVVTTCHTPGRGQTCENPTSESAKTKLKTDDIRKLMDGIRSSGFLELQNSYGSRNFSYPKTISVKMEDINKSVVYRGGIDALPAPEAFVSVEKLLETLASKVLPSDAPKIPPRRPEK